jgi:hypothetical protein
MYRLLVDFNDIESDIVAGLDRDVTGPQPRVLHLGDRVRLHDDGQHEAWGTVTDVDGRLISAKLDRNTWGPTGHIRVVPGTPTGASTWWAHRDTRDLVVGSYENEAGAEARIGQYEEHKTSSGAA